MDPQYWPIILVTSIPFDLLICLAVWEWWKEREERIKKLEKRIEELEKEKQ